MAETVQKDYLTIGEAAKKLKRHRTSLYPYLNALQIKRHKFPLSRKRYISAADFERIKQVIEEPWKVESHS